MEPSIRTQTSASIGPQELGEGTAIALPEGETIWEVQRGSIEVYLVWSEGRRLIALIEEGGHLFPTTSGANVSLRIVATSAATIAPVKLDPELTGDAAERWIRSVGRTLGGSAPTGSQLAAGDGIDVDAGQLISAGQGVIWLSPGPGLALDLCDCAELTLSPDLLPVAGSLWARAKSTGTLTAMTTDQVKPQDLMAALGTLTEALASLHGQRAARQEEAALARLSDTPGTEQGRVGKASEAVLEIADAIGSGEAPNLPPNADALPIAALCRIAGLRARKIMLEEGWHRRDHGALVVHAHSDDRVHALHWDGVAYRLKGGGRLSGEDAEAFRHRAYVVSASLPAKVQGLWSLALFVLKAGNRRDVVASALAAACAAGLGILVPIAMAWLLSDLVPSGAAGLLVSVGVALAVSAVVTAILGAAQGLSGARIDGRGTRVLGTAMTDRLLRLPASFFKDFAAGDLNQRIENVEAMRRLGMSVLLSAGMTAILSVTYLGVLFFYDLKLAFLGMLLVAGYIVGVVTARVLQMPALREAATLDGEIASLTYETLDGIGKLRASAAEERAMARWEDVYRRERAAGERAGRVSVGFGAFSDAYQTVTLMTLFAGAGALVALEAPAGIFIGFLAAFGSFQGAFVGLSEALLQVYSAQPLVERARPILEAVPEVDPGRSDPGNLQGEIEGSGLVFAYDKGGSPVLDGLDFLVRPGEHMAIVGGSGSGKSTLLRLLLGFETPQRGAILYDGQDLSRLDLTRVRSQIGVVLQASKLFAGSILDNIRGASDASLEACLAAAERAGLAKDLSYFAMGVHTPITEGAGTLSGGQRQRILIARALASDPNILFFDEATSALDNATQAQVSDTLDALKVTRVTIAHRLSTVRHADRICVLVDGRFAEQGTYDELMALDGAFARLARRQLTED